MDLVNHIASISSYFLEKLEEVREHPLVGDVRGIGLICGIELMRDGKKRIPFEKKLNVAGRFHENALKNGLIPRVVGDRLVFAPPLIITREEIDIMGLRFTRALDETWRQIRNI